MEMSLKLNLEIHVENFDSDGEQAFVAKVLEPYFHKIYSDLIKREVDS